MTTYFSNIYNSISTILVGMWITFKTAFLERKVTIQYPSFDVLLGKRKDEVLFPNDPLGPPFEPLQGANQDYRGPLRRQVSERFRGFLSVDLEHCDADKACVRTCPIGVITVERVRIKGHKGMVPTRFSIDYLRCMYCGLCVEACPRSALFFTRNFEGASADCRGLVREFVSPEARERLLEAAAAYKREKQKDKERGPK